MRTKTPLNAFTRQTAAAAAKMERRTRRRRLARAVHALCEWRAKKMAENTTKATREEVAAA